MDERSGKVALELTYEEVHAIRSSLGTIKMAYPLLPECWAREIIGRSIEKALACLPAAD